jgi:hypothetical protein
VNINIAQLRNFAAVLASLSGLSQAWSLWFLPTTPTLLMTALCGAFYLLLALGLFGISRFSLFLAVILPLLRSWLSLWPLPIDAWEQLRVLSDVAIAATCVPVLWVSVQPNYRKPRIEAAHTSEESSA